MPFPESIDRCEEGRDARVVLGLWPGDSEHMYLQSDLLLGLAALGHAARTLVPFLVVRNLAVTGPQPLAIETSGLLITTSSGDGAF